MKVKIYKKASFLLLKKEIDLSLETDSFEDMKKLIELIKSSFDI